MKQNEISNAEELLQRRVVANNAHTPESDVFRMLRTKVIKQLNDNNWNSFGITAPTQGAGKSLVAVNLAMTIAMDQNYEVLLVDMDLRYPKIHWYLDLNITAGLRDYVLSDIPLSDVIINSGFDRLQILPGRGQAIGSSEIVSAPKMQALIAEIKSSNKNKIVIFDLPPILATDDVLASFGYYDAMLLVVEDGKNKPADITQSLRLLSGTKLLGTVLNKSDTPPEGQYYYVPETEK